MGLLALAIAPGIVICLFIYIKDKYDHEPLYLLLLAFVLGVFSIIPALIIELVVGKSISEMMAGSVLYTAIYAYLIVGLSEEGSKFIVLRSFAYPRKSFSNPFDGILFSVMIGMGFATIENIGYVLQHGFSTGIVRMFLSVPAHATFAILMGYYVSLAKYDAAKRRWYFFLAIFWAVIFHGTFDFFLFRGTTLLHILGALASFIIAVKLSLRAIRRKQLLSQRYTEGNDSIEEEEHSLFRK